MRDRVTQIVLGIFAGIFTYCLIVLRAIRGADEGGFVPNLAVFFGVVLAIGGIGILIFFIHHIASSIQASSLIASVADETMAAVDRLFPGKLGQGPVEDDEDQARLPLPERNWQALPAKGNGYIQSVDNAALLRLAQEHKTIVRMERGVGEFVVHDTTLASLALEDLRKKRLLSLCRRHTVSAATVRWNRISLSASDKSWIWLASTLTQHQRHHDGRDVRGLSDGDSGAAGLPKHPFIAPL